MQFAQLHRHKALSLIVFLTIAYVAVGQKPFEGRIVYKVEYIEFPDGADGMELALPEEVAAVVNGQSSLIRQYSALAGEFVLLDASNTDSVFQVFELLDKTVALPVLRTSPKERKFRIVQTKESLTLLNRTLVGYMMQTADGEHYVAWVDERFQNPFRHELTGLCCLPLKYEITKNGIRMRLEAISISEEPIDKTYFQLPPDAVRIDQRTLQKIVN